MELSGGIRDDESLAAALATGAARVNIGTAALEDPDWCDRVIAEYGDRVAVGLDVRGRTLAARGWTRDGGDLCEVLARLDAAGCARYVVTDITKDGTLRGPEPGPAARGVRRAPTGPVVACGGVSSLDDLRALADAGPRRRRGRDRRQGAVRGRVHLAEALATWRRWVTDAGREPGDGHPARVGRPVGGAVRLLPGGPGRSSLAWTAGCTATVDGRVVHVGDAAAQTARRCGSGWPRWPRWVRAPATWSGPGCTWSTGRTPTRWAGRTTRSSARSGRRRRWWWSPV